MRRVPRIAVAGCGHWGKNLVRTFGSLGALTAISDPDPDTAKQVSGTASVPAMAFEDILRDAAIDAVVIAAPAATHHSLAREALLAGKHVFVEKPLALEVEGAVDLCDLAMSQDRILMVGHLLQYHPAFVRLKELVEGGRLGRLRYLYSNRLNLGRFRREENILWSFAPHDISMILSLIGDEPESVTAVGGWFLHEAIADVTTTHLSFSGGERAHIFVSWLHPYKDHRVVVIGDRAMAVFDDSVPWSLKLRLFPHEIEWRHGVPAPVHADAESIEIEEEEPLLIECRHFLESIQSGTQPRTDGREGLRVLKVLHAAEEAMGLETKKPTSDAARRQPDVFIHESAYVDEPSEIGPGTKIWHFSHVMAGSTVGRNCTVGQNVMIGPDVSIGDDCKLQNNVSIYKGVKLEAGVFCGPSCVFTNVLNPRADIDRSDEFVPTLVGRGATIGANATILCGITIGAYSLVAAGAVVTHDVPSHALVAGVPARRTGWVSHAGERLADDLVCPRTGRRYTLVGPDQLEELRD